MNIKSRPTFLSDMVIGNLGELRESFLNQEIANNTLVIQPAIEVAEKESHFEVMVALPGIKKENISIEIEDNRLKISGERSSKSESDQSKIHISEFRYGKFKRAILLPKNVDYDKIEAFFEDGILNISVPKQEIAKPKNIAIK